MPLSYKELYKGAQNTLKKIFERKLSKFDIGWFQEKVLKHSHTGGILKHKYKDKYEIQFRDPQAFLHSVNEIFIDEIYKFETNISSPIIIDCGANIGMSILYFKSNYPNSKILAFEPDEENFRLLNANLNNWKFDDVEIKCNATWINNENVIFNSKGELAGKIETNKSDNKDESNKIIQAKRLKDLIKNQVDLLKIDIEGAEYEVMKDCDNNLINVEKIFIEFHSNYNEIFKLNEILNILVKNNFYYYIKEAGVTYKWPFAENKTKYDYDVQLNIFALKNK